MKTGWPVRVKSSLLVCHVTQYETGLLLELASGADPGGPGGPDPPPPPKKKKKKEEKRKGKKRKGERERET